MRKLAGVVFLILAASLISYLLFPEPDFPEAPPDSVQSTEPADSETPFRRAYFTNYTRQEILDYYRNQFPPPLGLSFLNIKLIYPPEEAFMLIRDQTRSTHLIELVHPLRESLFINEFVAKSAKDDIWYKGVHYRQKITVKIIRSSRGSRLLMALAALVLTPILIREWYFTLKEVVGEIKKKTLFSKQG